ncbi:MAG TPA: NADH-quinone oxidoreductase subunit C [Usitatibacter sp.]|nr:NADH-quinone oxidoreductase subunit C [Usitatibacter sp.]
MSPTQKLRTLHAVLAEGEAAARIPWPRVVVGREAWREAVSLLRLGDCTLLGLWAADGAVHMAVMDEARSEPAVLTIACEGGAYPSVGHLHPAAIRLERALQDLSGVKADGLPDPRAWLDHGRWPLRHPLGGRELPIEAAPYAFLPVEGASLHRIPVGPVHAGIIEPGHFRFTANGETIVRLEERLGYVHKGIESLMAGATIERGAILAGRVSGDSTVAYAWAFARAVEAAWRFEVPRRAASLRAIMAELERLANHLGDIGAICNDAAFALLNAQFAYLREQVLRASQRCFGHRLMMDAIVPGGVRADLPQDGATTIRDLLALLRKQFPELVELYDNTVSLQDRTVSTGILDPRLAKQFGAGGFVGRASGRRFDARRAPGYVPYDELSFDVPVREEGDVDARVWIRIAEVEQSLAIVEQLLDRLPVGAIAAALPASASPAEGIALIEGFRGDILAWIAIGADARIVRCHLRDPSWFQWPLLEAVIEGNIVADFPLCNKSFNCSYSGHDL